MQDNNWSPDDIFAHLEEDFNRVQERRRTKMLFVAGGAVAGLAVIVFTLSTSVVLALAGYLLALVCVYRLALEARDKVNLKVAELNAELLDRQRRRQEFMERYSKRFKRDD